MSRNVAVLASARIPMSAARALAGIVVPIYLALIGFSAVELGELFLTAALASAVISGVSGPVSDRFGRRVFLIGVPMLTALAAVIFALTTRPALLFAGAALGAFGRGAGAGAGAVGPYQPVESATVAESTAASWRNAAFGRLAAASSAGALAGGLLATLAGAAHLPPGPALAAYRPVFLVAAALAAAAGLLGLAVREPVQAGRGAAPGAGGRTAGGIRFPRRSLPLLARLWVTNLVNGAAVGMFGPFVTYWFFRRFGAGPAQLGVLYAVINAVTVVSGLAAAGVARRLGLLRAIVLIRGLQAALLVPMVMAPTFWLAGAVYLVRMGVQRIALPLRQSFVLAAADPGELASVAALSNVPSQLAMAGAPVATGYLFDEVSLALPFLAAAGLQGLNALLYWVFFRSVRPPEEEEQRGRPRGGRGRPRVGGAATAPGPARQRTARR
jgi:predicted MFS family arabinose efflux permease